MMAMRSAMRSKARLLILATALGVSPLLAAAAESPSLGPINQRFASGEGDEVPSFQRHVSPLFGRLGCNGRSCHGSFQGRGGFQLSLFGYDFQADHAALFDKDSPRIDTDEPDESLILVKPTDADMHDGGQRYEKGGWEYHVLRRWIEAGAEGSDEPDQLVQLEIQPEEILFQRTGEQIQLKALAVWKDGTREDVTPLCRFQTNDDQIAEIDQDGRVTAKEPGDTHVVVFYDNGVTPVPVIQPVSNRVGERYPQVDTPTQIDRLVVDKLRKLGVVPAELSGDAEFLRRVSLDMTGTLPSPGEVEAFLADKSPDKRARKIDQLLESPAYAAWWTTRLCDFTGNNDDLLNNVGIVRGRTSQEWYDWIYRRVADNVPYDELVAGIVTAVSRREGQSYTELCREMSDLYRDQSDASFADLPSMTHYWSRRDFRDPDARAIAFAYSFMGIRIQCAQCHKHPFDQWSKDDFHEFKTFFTSVVASPRPLDPQDRKQYDAMLKDLGLKGKNGGDLRREVPKLLRAGKTVPFPEVVVDPRRLNPGPKAGAKTAATTARLLGGDEYDLSGVDDPRVLVMDWLRGKNNRFFARALVNRVWASYFNVGIVDPPDDLSLANPPSNGPLLDALASGFIDSGFDMKWLHREIANSQTYQRSWESNDTNRTDARNFSHAIPRRLPAEVLYDAIRQATSADAANAAWGSELDGRAIAIAGAGTRANRAGGAGYALTVFGRSTRESNCDCDRSSESSLLQTVYLHNDQELLQLISDRQGGWVREVREQLGGSSGPSAVDRKTLEQRLQAAQRRLAPLDARLRKLKRSGNQRSAAPLEKQVATLKAQIRNIEKQLETPPVDASVVSGSTEAVIRQAYLRTLSRLPSEEELAKSLAYVDDAENPVDGVRDVLWALLNTKEFILNH
jgi:hypothetical protein